MTFFLHVARGTMQQVVPAVKAVCEISWLCTCNTTAEKQNSSDVVCVFGSFCLAIETNCLENRMRSSKHPKFRLVLYIVSIECVMVLWQSPDIHAGPKNWASKKSIGDCNLNYSLSNLGHNVGLKLVQSCMRAF